MTENNNTTTVIVERGTYYLGGKSCKTDGTTEERPPRWVADPTGSSVIVSAYDLEKNEQIGEASIFSWRDSIGIDNCVRENLKLSRRSFPTPEELYRWIKNWDGRNVDLCEDICEGACAGYDCSICTINLIKLEQ